MTRKEHIRKAEEYEGLMMEAQRRLSNLEDILKNVRAKKPRSSYERRQKARLIGLYETLIREEIGRSYMYKEKAEYQREKAEA